MDQVKMAIKEGYINQLKSRLYSCLCEYEQKGAWEEMLDKILIELMGFPEESKTIDYYIIYYKLSSARYLGYKYFRTTIFDTMSLLSRLEV